MLQATHFFLFLFLFYFILFIFFEKKPPLKKKVSNEYRRKSKGQEKDSERLGWLEAMANRLVKQSSIKTVSTSSFSNSADKIASGDLCKKTNFLLDQFNGIFGGVQGPCVYSPKITTCVTSLLGMIHPIKKATVTIYLIVISLADSSTNDEDVKSFVR